MLKKILLCMGVLVMLGGCVSSGKVFRGKGIDRIPISSCLKCDKKPFYVDGQWVNDK